MLNTVSDRDFLITRSVIVIVVRMDKRRKHVTRHDDSETAAVIRSIGQCLKDRNSCFLKLKIRIV